MKGKKIMMIALTSRKRNNGNQWKTALGISPLTGTIG